jgi:anti-sigma factor RsiW
MSTCRELAETLYEFVAGEIAPHRHTELHQHLARCPPCAALVQTYRHTICLARGLRPTPMPPGLLSRLERALEGAGGTPAGGAGEV